jgi:hypothetical protein
MQPEERANLQSTMSVAERALARRSAALSDAQSFEAYQSALLANLSLKMARTNAAITAARANTIQASETALTLVTRDRAPEEWAVLQLNLAEAVAADTNRREVLARAAAAYENALSVLTRERHRESWLAAQSGLAGALHTSSRTEQHFGHPEVAEALLTRAIEAYENALTAVSRESAPIAWARTQERLSYALWDRGPRDDPAVLARIAQAREALLTVYTRDYNLTDWAQAKEQLAEVYHAQGRDAEARTVALEALSGWEQFGNELAAQSVRDFIRYNIDGEPRGGPGLRR